MKKVTLRDIAARAGVHPSTVSRALDPSRAQRVNAQTVNHIRQIADELGYRPDVIARGFRDGSTATFGVVVADLGNPYISPILRGIENNLEGRGLMAIIAETQDDLKRFNRVVEHLMSRRVDALITTAASGEHLPLLHAIADRIPVVLAVQSPADSDLPHVVYDDAEGAKLVAEHLLSLGHRRIGQLRGSPIASTFVQRTAGFAAAIETGGGTLVNAPEIAHRPTIDEGVRVMRSMTEQEAELPTAIFAHNDLMALGAIQVLRGVGFRCPDDVSIVGYDDIPMAPFTSPSLTTIRHPSYELGRMAADYAVTLLENLDHRPEQLRFPATLVIRGSTSHVDEVAPGPAATG